MAQAQRRDGTCGACQANYRAASTRAAQAARPLQPVLGSFLGFRKHPRGFELPTLRMRLPRLLHLAYEGFR
jgi:hypothetical protein